MKGKKQGSRRHIYSILFYCHPSVHAFIHPWIHSLLRLICSLLRLKLLFFKSSSQPPGFLVIVVGLAAFRVKLLLPVVFLVHNSVELGSWGLSG